MDPCFMLISIMSSTRTVHTRQNSKVEDWDTLSLDDVLSKNRRARERLQRLRLPSQQVQKSGIQQSF